jgi:glutamate racemase
MIGVFDSGFGGLTIHRALVDTLPDQDFVYLGDNKNAPYGTRPPIEVLNLTCAGLERLFQEGCQLVVVACNTSSAVTLRWIQQHWLPIRNKDGVKRNALSIIVPTIESATGLSWNETCAESRDNTTIAVFATTRTVESDVYPFEIKKRRPDIRVVQQACPDLASAIENDAPTDVLRGLVRGYVSALKEVPDRVILGCTHYPLVADLFAEALPAGLPIIHQPAATAFALKDYLTRHPEYTAPSTGVRRFLSTGFSGAAPALIQKFWGADLVFEQA